MSERVRWGVLGAAKIAVEKVIPAMQRGEWSRVVALASRDAERARRAADSLGVGQAYGSYEELLADESVEAVYIPLPNHLHVEWAVRAAEAGKHVLVEKPVGLNAEEARRLVEARDRAGVKIQEAFMVRTHPQWLAAREVVRSGRVGELRSVNCTFTYFNRDPANIRNQQAVGGGALLDIGCYPVNLSRFVFGHEPRRVFAFAEQDPEWRVDRTVSAVLDFGDGARATFTCATQLAPYQRMHFHGTRGRVEVEIPFNAPNDRPTRILIGEGASVETREFGPCDQYTVQGDLFSRAVREGTEQPVPLEDALGNMLVLDALFRSADTGAWEVPA